MVWASMPSHARSANPLGVDILSSAIDAVGERRNRDVAHDLKHVLEEAAGGHNTLMREQAGQWTELPEEWQVQDMLRGTDVEVQAQRVAPREGATSKSSKSVMHQLMAKNWDMGSTQEKSRRGSLRWTDNKRSGEEGALEEEEEEGPKEDDHNGAYNVRFNLSKISKAKKGTRRVSINLPCGSDALDKLEALNAAADAEAASVEEKKYAKDWDAMWKREATVWISPDYIKEYEKQDAQHQHQVFDTSGYETNKMVQQDTRKARRRSAAELTSDTMAMFVSLQHEVHDPHQHAGTVHLKHKPLAKQAHHHSPHNQTPYHRSAQYHEARYPHRLGHDDHAEDEVANPYNPMQEAKKFHDQLRKMVTMREREATNLAADPHSTAAKNVMDSALAGGYLNHSERKATGEGSHLASCSSLEATHSKCKSPSEDTPRAFPHGPRLSLLASEGDHSFARGTSEQENPEEPPEQLHLAHLQKQLVFMLGDTHKPHSSSSEQLEHEQRQEEAQEQHEQLPAPAPPPPRQQQLRGSQVNKAYRVQSCRHPTLRCNSIQQQQQQQLSHPSHGPSAEEPRLQRRMSSDAHDMKRMLHSHASPSSEQWLLHCRTSSDAHDMSRGQHHGKDVKRMLHTASACSESPPPGHPMMTQPGPWLKAYVGHEDRGACPQPGSASPASPSVSRLSQPFFDAPASPGPSRPSLSINHNALESPGGSPSGSRSPAAGFLARCRQSMEEPSSQAYSPPASPYRRAPSPYGAAPSPPWRPATASCSTGRAPSARHPLALAATQAPCPSSILDPAVQPTKREPSPPHSPIGCVSPHPPSTPNTSLAHAHAHAHPQARSLLNASSSIEQIHSFHRTASTPSAEHLHASNRLSSASGPEHLHSFTVLSSKSPSEHPYSGTAPQAVLVPTAAKAQLGKDGYNTIGLPDSHTLFKDGTVLFVPEDGLPDQSAHMMRARQSVRKG